ncbi:MAG: hypothetical protein RMN51_01535 [Verrucomicrobiota bacterium]|nr:hypothetical protein [Limisphaera sp.]MDW8380781.1 hypothetical protein [Verrucomicrobiota bacterium]
MKSLAWLVFSLWGTCAADEPWLRLEPMSPFGQPPKHIVLMAGDEEYRSEEGLAMLGRLLAERHGFRCTVLFSINPEDGTIDPNNQTNVPGLHHLATADLVILQFRFRELPDSDMKHFVDYLHSGRPLIALRTSTHAFQYERNPASPYAHFDWRSRSWPGGFGQQVLGETWIAHHGEHGRESTRGLIDGRAAWHPVLRGVRNVWGPSDVYAVRNLKATDQVLMHGLVLRGMQADALPHYDKPLMPMVWIRDHVWPHGAVTRSLTSTIGAAVDLQSEGLRRLLVNACYWLTGRDVPDQADVTPPEPFQPTMFGFDRFVRGRKPSDFRPR